ncbi:Hydroxyproline-rich glycoprotein family protein isoform 2 [Senna tora]|uniref:Hydroxyproline-rich glycoprotein family protein isoform 2 n=1 Tax=Senna tora TaxID=362788 RepID=A0A834T3I3_9FABA|nr:Hydroxyproline-rich glycoprotein family protein isoform 2 [Senna tora]
MGSVPNNINNSSVDTVNAAAAAIVTAESRVQPSTVLVSVSFTPMLKFSIYSTVIKKKRGGSCWSLYWCFGSHKSSKRIGHAVLVPEPVAPAGPPASSTAPNHSTAIVMPFIAPPSSPISVLQSDPPSATESSAGLLSGTSLSFNAYSTGGPASIFTIGPYAYDTQLVSPPVFSNFTTEPSTAPFTPPSESVQMTTPSSPEVPFAQLLSSLDRARRNSGTNPKFGVSNYEFQPYQQYPASPGGQLRSPGSAISTSGTSTPGIDRRPILELCNGEPPKHLSYEYFSTRRWSSRLGSGSLTPNGARQGSRLGSGSLTPDGVGQASQLGSGCLTPATRDNMFGVKSLANSGNECQTNSAAAALADHQRVSFELSGEDVARCLASKSGVLIRNMSGPSRGILARGIADTERTQKDTIYNNSCDLCSGKTSNGMSDYASGEEEKQCCYKHHHYITPSSKEFQF